MAALAQQQLLEPPPARRIIVAPGHNSWWGVDGSTTRVAIGAVTGHGDTLRRAVSETPFAKLDGASRLAEIYRATRATAIDLAERYPPGIILVEQPSGSDRAVNHELEYAIGVIQAAIYDGTFHVLRHGVKMETVVSSWWKLKACGRGNIYKTHKVPGKARKQPLPLEEYGVMQWARLNGYQGNSWDSADALAMAEAARREIALDAR